MKTILMSVVAVMFIGCTADSNASDVSDNLYGNIAVTSVFGEEDFELNTSYLGFGTKTHNVGFYGTYDAKEDSFSLLEANVSFGLDGFYVTVGSQAVNYGHMYLDRPNSSVFVSTPKMDRYAAGVNILISDETLKVNGFYGENDLWSVSGQYLLFGDMFVPGYSYNDLEEHTMFTTFTSTCPIGTVVNLSEWNHTAETFWSRTTIDPAGLDHLGFMVGYYDTEAYGLQEFRNVAELDAWTVGAYIDIDGVTFSSEWKMDGDLMPITLQASTSF